MVNKFLIGIAAIVIVMATLIALPSVTQPTSNLEVDYGKQRMSRSGTEFVTTNNELVHISKDGSATYSSSDPRTSAPAVEKQFSLNSEEMSSLRGLLTETGFMEIPQADYAQVKDGAGDFTKYTLTVKSGDATKTFAWVDSDVSKVAVPSIITKAGFQIDSLVQSKT